MDSNSYKVEICFGGVENEELNIFNFRSYTEVQNPCGERKCYRHRKRLDAKEVFGAVGQTIAVTVGVAASIYCLLNPTYQDVVEKKGGEVLERILSELD